MALLQTGESVLILLDSRFELFYILGTSFSERGLGLSIALLALFRSRVDLQRSTWVSNGLRQLANVRQRRVIR
jgi:hypothetical protein